MSRLASGNRNRQFTQRVPLRFGERADAACDAFEPLAIRSIEPVQRPLERRPLDHHRLVRFKFTESLGLPAHCGLALPMHGVDDFGGDCECSSPHPGTTPADALSDPPLRYA